MTTVGGYAEAPLAARTNAMLLHQPLHPLLAHAQASLAKLAPHARSPVSAVRLGMHRADVQQKCLIRHVTPSRNLRPPQSMLVIARGADAEHAALHTDRPDKTMLINKGEPHFWPFASRVARRNCTSALSQNRT